MRISPPGGFTVCARNPRRENVIRTLKRVVASNGRVAAMAMAWEIEQATVPGLIQNKPGKLLKAKGYKHVRKNRQCSARALRS